jgi:hypothetical protein
MITTCGKFQYADKKTVRTAANFRQHRRHGHRRGKVKRLRAYHCPYCNGWHLTSRA